MEPTKFKICLRGLPWDIWFRCPGVRMKHMFNPIFRRFFRCTDINHRISINLRTILVDGKEMVLCEKEMLPLYDGVLRRKDGTRCVQ